MDNNAPKKIYLLCYGESREESGENIFWSEDRINDTDEEYHHVSEIERLKKLVKKAYYEAMINSIEGINVDPYWYESLAQRELEN